MTPLELLSTHTFDPDTLEFPVQLGAKLGCGQDGIVYEISNSKDRVGKLSIQLLTSKDIIPYEAWKQTLDNLALVQQINPSHIVKIYWFDQILTHEYKTLPYSIYWTEMERLFPLSEDEKKVCHTVLSHEDAQKPKNYTQDQLNKVLAELSIGLDYDIDRMTAFCLAIKNSFIKHNDIHPRNIMKDKDGNFKLIDLNRITIKKTE